MRSTPNTKSPLPFWTDRKKTSLGRLKGGNLVGRGWTQKNRPGYIKYPGQF